MAKQYKNEEQKNMAAVNTRRCSRVVKLPKFEVLVSMFHARCFSIAMINTQNDVACAAN